MHPVLGESSMQYRQLQIGICPLHYYIVNVSSLAPVKVMNPIKRNKVTSYIEHNPAVRKAIRNKSVTWGIKAMLAKGNNCLG